MSLLQDLFISIVNMSITASYVAIGVILVRLLLKKAPKIFSYILWIPVLFRLVCPFSFDSAFSFFNLINLNAKQGSGISEFVPQNIGLMQTPAIQSSIGSIDSAVNASVPSAIPVASVNPMQIWMAVFSLIWIFGVIALLIYSIISYVKIKGKLQTATRVDGNVFETDAISTAFVCGFIRPKIYVPANIGDANLSYILEHERTHIRRKDYLIKPLAFLALILHWFNPFIWLCFVLMSRDMEMSCDESVLHRLGEGAKGGYSGSLLSLAVKRKGLLAANPLAFGESHVKARIKNILNFKKPAFWAIMVAVVAVCAAAIPFVANPSESAAYISEDYKISLKYPSYWELNPNYVERYEGKDGFFQVGAIDGENMTIDEVARNDAFHKLNPYGSDPKIINRTIDGQEARLILPSADQPEEMHNQAGLIVKYPEAVKIGGSAYHYFILWADEAHIEQIGNTLTFLKKQIEAEKNSDTSTEGIAKFVEENLAIIMSSPKQALNPYAYIQAHQEEYENIKKLGGEEALQYMLSQFESGNAEGLRGYIMMQLCKELLGVRNNVTDETLTPQEWYDALSIRHEVKLPDFEYDGNDPIEKLVYATEIEKNSQPQRGFAIVAPKIFGSYEEDGLLKVFVTTFSATYKLYDNVLDEVGGSVVPSAITYKKDNSGNYVLEKYEQAKDGADWLPSIRKFCTMPVSGKEIPELADKIIDHYGNYDDIRTLRWKNLFKHLKANGIKDATLFNSRGEIEFFMSNPQYIN